MANKKVEQVEKMPMKKFSKKKEYHKTVKPTPKESLTVYRRMKLKYPGMDKKHAEAIKNAKSKSRIDRIIDNMSAGTKRLAKGIRKSLKKDRKKTETVATKETKRRLKKTSGIDWDADRPTKRLMKGKK